MIEFGNGHKMGAVKTHRFFKKSYSFDDDDALLKIKVTRKPYSMASPPDLNLNKDYLRKISSDLLFSEDVLKDRCFHLLPYDKKYFRYQLPI